MWIAGQPIGCPASGALALRHRLGSFGYLLGPICPAPAKKLRGFILLYLGGSFGTSEAAIFSKRGLKRVEIFREVAGGVLLTIPGQAYRCAATTL